jgi:hypothetical protein
MGMRILSSQLRARRQSPRAHSFASERPGTRPSRAACAYAPSGFGPRGAYLSRKRSQRSLQDEMDPGGKPKIHRRGSSFVAIGNQFAMTRPSPPAARMATAYCRRNSTGSDDPLKRAGVVGQKCHGQSTCRRDVESTSKPPKQSTPPAGTPPYPIASKVARN